MPQGILRSDRAICDAIPYPYSCVHILDYYGEDVFPMPSNPNSRRFPPNRWILCKYDKRADIDFDALAIAKSSDFDDTAKINRIKGRLKAMRESLDSHSRHGDFKNPVECCQYLLQIGILKAMPKAAVEKQNAQLESNGNGKNPEKVGNGKPTHLTKLENAPEYIMTLRTLEMLEFFGSEENLLKAVSDTLSHLRESEIKWNKAVESFREQGEALGLDPDEIEADLQKKKRARVEKLAATLTLDYPKREQ